MTVTKHKKRIVALAAGALLALAAIGAYAYFTSTGSGTGSATVGDADPWTVSVADVSGGPLYPGSGTENKTYTVTNASAGQQMLNAVSIRIANADGTAWTAVAGCSKDDFELNAAGAGTTETDTYGAAGNNYANGAGTGAVSFTVKMVDTGANQDGCKNATPPILVSAS